MTLAPCHAVQVRALVDSLGTEVGAAPPSIAVQMGGFGAVPTAGDEFAVRRISQTLRRPIVHL